MDKRSNVCRTTELKEAKPACVQQILFMCVDIECMNILCTNWKRKAATPVSQGNIFRELTVFSAHAFGLQVSVHKLRIWADFHPFSLFPL